MKMKFRNIIQEHKKKMKEDMTQCIICKRYFEGYGNNASPLAEGLCCDECNIKVIKARLKQK